MSQTKTDSAAKADVTFQRQYPIALLALAKHVLAHQLPAPMSIETDFLGRQIVVVLPGFTDYELWLTTLHVDAEDNEERHIESGSYYRTIWTVRLPDTVGVVVKLRGSRPVPLPKLVSA